MITVVRGRVDVVTTLESSGLRQGARQLFPRDMVENKHVKGNMQLDVKTQEVEWYCTPSTRMNVTRSTDKICRS